MDRPDFKFSGDEALSYDKYLGPLLFEPFAEYTGGLIVEKAYSNILEIACGTGRLTHHINLNRSVQSKFIASDINTDMINIAKKKLKNADVTFILADAQELPFENNCFDLVICQFGLMFFPDKAKALQEIIRVLQPGGKFIFSTWDDTINSPLLKLMFNEILLPYFMGEKAKRLFVPFSLHDKKILEEMNIKEGFSFCKAEHILLPAGNVSKENIINGFFLKHGLMNAVKEINPQAIPLIISQMESQIPNYTNNNTSFYNLSALLGEATK